MIITLIKKKGLPTLLWNTANSLSWDINFRKNPSMENYLHQRKFFRFPNKLQMFWCTSMKRGFVTETLSLKIFFTIGIQGLSRLLTLMCVGLRKLKHNNFKCGLLLGHSFIVLLKAFKSDTLRKLMFGVWES